jgi:hypothetical protein
MAILTRAEIEAYYLDGAFPSESNFNDFIDSAKFEGDPLFYASNMWADYAANIGTKIPLQPWLGSKRIMMMFPAPASTTPTILGFSGISATGTLTTAAWAATTFRQQMARTLYRSAGTAGQTASWRANHESFFWRGDAAGRGGFTVSFRFSIPAQPSGYLFFCGLRNSSATPGATTDPSTLVDLVGLGKDSADTTLQFLHNDNVGNCTKVNTGLTPSTDTFYQLIIHCEPNGTVVYFVLRNVETGSIVSSHTSITTNLPLITTSAGLMRPIQFISNNATASAVDCEMAGFYGEANN